MLSKACSVILEMFNLCFRARFTTFTGSVMPTVFLRCFTAGAGRKVISM